MENLQRKSNNDFNIENFLGYFDQQILAAYYNEPNKYTVQSDFFQGDVIITDEYYLQQEDLGQEIDYINVRFGYRTLKNGYLAIVAWLPDLYEKSKNHIKKWEAFSLNSPEWTTDYDERFDKWIKVNIEGNWSIKSGPLTELAQSMKLVNAISNELVGLSLYKYELDKTLGYPSAETTHSYQDSHKRLYGYLIDGIDKACVSRLAEKLKIHISNIDNIKTIKAIKEMLPELENSKFTQAINLISEQRRIATHQVRPKAEKFRAFSRFTEDLRLCSQSFEEILEILESKFGITRDQAYKRHNAKKMLPKITHRPELKDSFPISIIESVHMKGKTIERVEFGLREKYENVHESQVLIIYFTDGSIICIDTGSNIANLVGDDDNLKPEDLHIDLDIHWVPEL
jgi:hypothetical protein